MKHKNMRMATMTFALVVGCSAYNIAYAKEAEEQKLISGNYSIISPLWANISDISPRISADGTTLYPEVYIEAKSSAGAISGTMYLENYTSGKWTTVTSWNISGIGNVFLSKTYQGISGRNYRVRIVVTVSGEKEEVTSGICAV